MINRKEFEICKRRGHQIGGSILSTGWSQCPACAAWVREVATIEQREDRPSENEISSGFNTQIAFGLMMVRSDEEPIDKEELEICKRRGHVLTFNFLRSVGSNVARVRFGSVRTEPSKSWMKGLSRTPRPRILSPNRVLFTNGGIVSSRFHSEGAISQKSP
jgi:hypothetical protein